MKNNKVKLNVEITPFDVKEMMTVRGGLGERSYDKEKIGCMRDGIKCKGGASAVKVTDGEDKHVVKH